jgi:hypothetical protein
MRRKKKLALAKERGRSRRRTGRRRRRNDGNRAGSSDFGQNQTLLPVLDVLNHTNTQLDRRQTAMSDGTDGMRDQIRDPINNSNTAINREDQDKNYVHRDETTTNNTNNNNNEVSGDSAGHSRGNNRNNRNMTGRKHDNVRSNHNTSGRSHARSHAKVLGANNNRN